MVDLEERVDVVAGQQVAGRLYVANVGEGLLYPNLNRIRVLHQ